MCVSISYLKGPIHLPLYMKPHTKNDSLKDKKVQSHNRIIRKWQLDLVFCVSIFYVETSRSFVYCWYVKMFKYVPYNKMNGRKRQEKCFQCKSFHCFIRKLNCKSPDGWFYVWSNLYIPLPWWNIHLFIQKDNLLSEKAQNFNRMGNNNIKQCHKRRCLIRKREVKDFNII